MLTAPARCSSPYSSGGRTSTSCAPPERSSSSWSTSMRVGTATPSGQWATSVYEHFGATSGRTHEYPQGGLRGGHRKEVAYATQDARCGSVGHGTGDDGIARA